LPDTGWGTLNAVASFGALILAVGVLVFLVNVFWAKRYGEVAGFNPWGADTLEWACPSPPPDYDFVHIPAVDGRHALWEQTDKTPVVRGLSTTHREVLVTSIMDAHPEQRYELPSSSIWPFLVSLATAVAFIGGIFTPWAFPAGGVLAFIFLFGWFWSDPDYGNTKYKEEPHDKPGAVETVAQPLRTTEA
jgi:cytochrome c oxidase subunit 1